MKEREWRVVFVSQHNEPSRYLTFTGAKSTSIAEGGLWDEANARRIAKGLQDHHDEWVVAEQRIKT